LRGEPKRPELVDKGRGRQPQQLTVGGVVDGGHACCSPASGEAVRPIRHESTGSHGRRMFAVARDELTVTGG